MNRTKRNGIRAITFSHRHHKLVHVEACPFPRSKSLICIGTKPEPFTALGVAAVWAIYGAIYFLRSSKASGRTTMVSSRAKAAMS